MKGIHVLIAAIVGVAVFAVIEIAGRQLGVFTALTPEIWMDALAYALAAVFVTWILIPLIKGRRSNVVVGTLVFFILYVIFTGIFGGAVDLIASGNFSAGSDILGAFVIVPVNMLLTVFLELWYVAVPAFLIGSYVIVRTARTT